MTSAMPFCTVHYIHILTYTHTHTDNTHTETHTHIPKVLQFPK